MEVPFGQKKLYAALVVGVHREKPDYPTRSILSVLDEEPIVTESQVRLWRWMATYYGCGLGEVMAAALPSMLKLHSQTLIMPGPALDEKIFDLDDKAYMIAEAVSIQKEITVDKIRDILQIKTVYPIIKNLMDNQVIAIKEELQDRFSPKQVTGIALTELYEKSGKDKVFAMVEKSEHQTRALLALIQLSSVKKDVRLEEVLKAADVKHSVIGSLEKKGSGHSISLFRKSYSHLRRRQGGHYVSV